MDPISQFFANTKICSDDNTRNHAEAQLQAAVESNYEGAVIALCGALATEGGDVGNRMQAALYLKNLFTAQDENIKRAKLSKWNDGKSSFLYVFLYVNV